MIIREVEISIAYFQTRWKDFESSDEKRRPNITPCNLAEELNDVNYKYFKIQLFHKLLIQFLNNWRGAERNNEQGEKVLKSVRRECVYTHICIKKMRARGGISGACLEETQQVGFIG